MAAWAARLAVSTSWAWMTELQTRRTVPVTDSSSFPRHFQKGGREEPGDAVVAPGGAPQPLGEEAVVEPFPAGRVAVDHYGP